jgi:N-acetylglutamate synthase
MVVRLGDVILDDATESAALAWLDVMSLAGSVPGGRYERTGPASALFSVGAALSGVNGVADVSPAVRTPDIGPAARRAAAELTAVPWSIQLRAEPDNEIVSLAVGLGRTTRSSHPFLVRMHAAAVRVPLPEELVVRPVNGSAAGAFTAALMTGFQASKEAMGPLGCAEVLDLPSASGYLAEIDGVTVGSALVLRSGTCAGVFNICVAPEYRRCGYGTALTSEVLARAASDGAETAFLHSSPAGLRVYESLGFRTVEHWTHFAP